MEKPTEGILRIGTSNIVVPGNKSTFPKQFKDKTRLNYYSSLFNSVEINSTFYKVPMCFTFKKWAEDVPAAFQFSIKFLKAITHVKDLEFSSADIDLFLKRVTCIGSKKGCLLLQFPGKITLKYFNKAEEILQAIKESAYSNEWEMAVEFRSSTWYVGETFELLDEHKASMVIHDFPKGRNEHANKKAKVIYVRLHGPEGNYRGSYSQEFLGKLSENIKVWRKDGKSVYVYFNNTIGDAFENAMRLKKLSKS